MKLTIKKIIVLISFILSGLLYSQQSLEMVKQQFEEFAKIKPGVNDVVKVDVAGLTVYDLITSIGQEHQLNVNVDFKLNSPVVYNFHDVKVKDILIFLIKEFDIEVEFMSNIIIFK